VLRDDHRLDERLVDHQAQLVVQLDRSDVHIVHESSLTIITIIAIFDLKCNGCKNQCFCTIPAKGGRKCVAKLRASISSLLHSALVCAIVIHMTNTTSTTVLSVRVNSEERALLESASEQARTSLSDFVRRKSLEAAEIVVLDRSVVRIPAKDWEAFEAWVARPAEAIPGLKKLARLTPTWQR